MMDTGFIAPDTPDDFDFPDVDRDTDEFIRSGLTDHPQGILHEGEPYTVTHLYQYPEDGRATLYQFFYNFDEQKVGVSRLIHVSFTANGSMHETMKTVVDPEHGLDAIKTIDNRDDRTVESKDEALELLDSHLPDYNLTREALI